MKITTEHYDYLRDSIVNLLKEKSVDVAEYRQSLVDEGKAKDVDMRMRWDFARAAVGISWICEVYSYMNDTHIDTALRNIMQEIS